MAKVIDVHIGEIKVAKRGEVLRAILGSCVGIGAVWPENKICALAHCLLPTNPAPSFAINGRFVDQALKSLIAILKIRPDDLSRPSFVIVGGGNMTSPEETDESKLIGSLNYETAIKEAKALGLTVVHSEGGGDQGRKIFVDSTTFSYRIEKIPRIHDAKLPFGES